MTDLRLYRKGSLLAVVLLLIIVLAVKWMAFSMWNGDTEPAPENLLEFVAEMDSLEAAGNVDRKVAEKTPVLHSFDPNVADSIELVGLGLRPFVARNIIRYREKGGVFRKPSDLARIYGMEEDVYASLEPYIRIVQPPAKKDPVKTVSMLAVHSDGPTSDSHGPKADMQTVTSPDVREKQRMELNAADSLSLVEVKGIGSYTARRIMAYRKALGGFVAVKQLDEIEGLRPENLENLKAMAYVDSSLVVPISLNTASLKHLQHHPYVSFPQAKAIVELRSHRHQPVTLNDLTTLEEFTLSDLQRLKPYLCE